MDTMHTMVSSVTRIVQLFIVTIVSIVVSSTPLLAQDERIAEIRVHGNHSTPDADVIGFSGLKVGDPATDESLRAAEKMIRVLHRFTDAEVRKRYLSISDPSQVLVMIVVDEKIGVTDTDLTPGWGKRLRASQMYMPIFNCVDGYGCTYGVRTTFPHVPDEGTRISVPLSWGGERRAGVEVDHWFGGSRGLYGVGRRDPTLRLLGGLSIYQRENPHFEVPDLRHEARVRVEKPLFDWLRVGATAKTARVAFGSDTIVAPGTLTLLVPRTEERHDSFLADVLVDTRRDPSFPRNAVYASLGRERLRWDGRDPLDVPGLATNTSRWLGDVRGYIGLGSPVIALRGQFVTANRPTPFSEQPLLGGTDSLRGYQAGVAASDNQATLSTELRVPLTSPVSVGRFGVKGFVDWGRAWNVGQRFREAAWERGIGGGIFFGAGPVILDLAEAWARDGSARFNFGLGVSF